MDKNYDVITFQKTFVLRRAGVANFADLKSLKTEENLLITGEKMLMLAKLKGCVK